MIAGTVVLVAALAAALVPPPETELDRMKELLQRGNAEFVAKAIGEPGTRERWVKAADSLRSLCDTASDNVEELAQKPAEAKKLFSLLVSMAEECLEAAPGSAPALRARACARLAACRLPVELKEEADPAAFEAVAADFAAAYEKDPAKGIDLSEQAGVLAEAAFLKGADAAELFRRVDALGEKALSAHPDAPIVTGHIALAMLRRGYLALERKERCEDWVIQKALDLLEPMEKDHADDIDLLTARNDAASLVRLLKLKKPKVDFVTRTCDFANGLTLEIPRSRFWAPPSSSGTAVHQFTNDFRTLRSLVVNDYKWDTNWTLADGSVVGGDNLKGIADKNFGIEARGFRKVKSKRGLLKGKLKGCDAGYLYEIVGLDVDGDPLAQRVWYWKSKGGYMTTYEVTLLAYRDNDPEDPTMDFVLDSIQEKPKK